MTNPDGDPTDMVVFTAQRIDGSGGVDGDGGANSRVKEPELKKKKPTPPSSENSALADRQPYQEP